MTKQIEVQVVFFRDEDTWVAQCVEYDIAAFAKHVKDLPRAFERALAANICANHDMGRAGLAGVPAAPQRYRNMVEDALRIETQHSDFQIGGNAPVRVRDLYLADAAA